MVNISYFIHDIGMERILKNYAGYSSYKNASLQKISLICSISEEGWIGWGGATILKRHLGR